jgi:hypothetical protein
MDSNTFTSHSGWFSLTLPKEWAEYDDEVEDTYAFFNTENWTGNFRITPFRFELPTESSEDKAYQFILDEITENEAATEIKIGDFPCAFYKQDSVGNLGDLVIYYWIIGRMNNLFTCSFTIDKKQEFTNENEAILETVRNIIRSIKIH